MNVTHKITMDLTRPTNGNRINVVEGDKNSRIVNVHLYENFVSWRVPTNASVLIKWERESGVGGEYSKLADGSSAWSAVGNILTITLSEESTEYSGNVKFSIVLTTGDSQISTFVIVANVHSVANGREGANSGTSSTDIAGLQKQIGNLSDLETKNKSNLVVAINEAAKSGGGSGETGADGGYYTPKVSQPSTNTMLVEHTPSKAGMPAVEPVTINLPVGSDSSQNGNQSGVGWSTEEILLLETILKNCVTASDQTNNISALIAMLKNNSSGSEGSGSGGGDSGTTYTVTLNLTDVASSNVAQYVKSGAAYMNQLTVADGYVLGTPVVTMGGYDVTSQYYDGEGNIAIANVTGDIEITCKALAVETLTIVSASGVPDKTTFAYSEVASFTQAQVVAKESSIVGGVLNVTWDTETITGGPTVRVYLFKDGTPYKLTSNTSNSNPVETSDGISDKSWWAVPGSYAFPLKLTKPASIAIPDGCTAMVCLQRNGMINDTVTSNATWSAWAGAGNLTVTVTEGE